MNIEADGCDYDWMEIKFTSGGNTDEKYCGMYETLSSTEFTGNGPVEIKFISDGSVEPGLGLNLDFQVELPTPVVATQAPVLSILTPSPIDPCENSLNPCQHGTCTNVFGIARCNCDNTGYEGQYCENDIDDCLGNICQNDSTCVDRLNSYDCICRDKFEGQYCENEILFCQNNPCLNGATCVEGSDSYICQCLVGFSGNECQNVVNLPTEVVDVPQNEVDEGASPMGYAETRPQEPEITEDNSEPEVIFEVIEEPTSCYSPDLNYNFNLGQMINFDCAEGTILSDSNAQRIQCLPNGQFSHSIPKCLPVNSNFASTNLQNLSPWQIITSIKWLFIIFIISLGIIFSMIGLFIYAFILAPWNDHKLAICLKSCCTYRVALGS